MLACIVFVVDRSIIEDNIAFIVRGHDEILICVSACM